MISPSIYVEAIPSILSIGPPSAVSDKSSYGPFARGAVL